MSSFLLGVYKLDERDSRKVSVLWKIILFPTGLWGNVTSITGNRGESLILIESGRKKCYNEAHEQRDEK